MPPQKASKTKARPKPRAKTPQLTKDELYAIMLWVANPQKRPAKFKSPAHAGAYGQVSGMAKSMTKKEMVEGIKLNLRDWPK